MDEDGDGYNDNAPDHDADGIPNALDPDFAGARNGQGMPGFVDLDGDGINDNVMNNRRGGRQNAAGSAVGQQSPQGNGMQGGDGIGPGNSNPRDSRGRPQDTPGYQDNSENQNGESNPNRPGNPADPPGQGNPGGPNGGSGSSQGGQGNNQN